MRMGIVGLPGLVLAAAALTLPAAADGWQDNFDGKTSLRPAWESSANLCVQPGAGFRGSGAVTGTAAAAGPGFLWRRAEAGPALEVTARVRIDSQAARDGALIGLSPTAPSPVPGDPLTPAFPPTAQLTGNYVALRVVKSGGDGKPDSARLQLTYANPHCGQSLPFKHLSGRLELDTWYDLRLRLWPRDGMVLARAWQRRSGAWFWTPVRDLWPGKAHVAAYEGCVPAYAAVAVSDGAFVDDVRVRSIRVPKAPRLPPAEPINEHRFTILSLSWSTPDTKFLHDRVADMEQTPFDGWTTYAAHPRLPHGRACWGTGKGDLSWEVFQKTRATRAQIEPAIEDLKTTRFERFRSNYVTIVSYLDGGQAMDWFDDEWWATIAANTELQGMLAREGGCEGILFDPEEYGCAFWGWPKLSQDPLYENRTYEQVRAKIRQRGREFARALNAAYPGVRILSIHAWDTARRYDLVRPVTKKLLPEVGYGLLPAFLDGILEGSDEDTVIIDGIENTYWVDALPDFVAKARSAREDGVKLSDVPRLFRRKMRVGFAVWLDRDHTGQPWNPREPARNHWTPERLVHVLGNALAAGDGMVWVYSETASFQLHSEERGDIDFGSQTRNSPGVMKPVPDAYRQALENGRRRAEELRRM